MKLGPLNLTWWRKRPSVHVADDSLWEAQNARLDGLAIINNFKITVLDPDEALFHTMLTKLPRKYEVSWLEDELFPRTRAKIEARPWGDWSWTELGNFVGVTLSNPDVFRHGYLVRSRDGEVRLWDGLRGGLWSMTVA